MFGRAADLSLMAEQLLGERDLADADQLGDALHVGKRGDGG